MNKKLVATLGVVMGLGLVAGCGSSDSPDGAGSSRSPGGTAQTTAPLELTEVDVDQWLVDFTAAAAQTTTVHAAVDKQTATGEGAKTMDMEVDIDVASATFAVDMELMGSPAQVVVADGTAYVSSRGGEPQALNANALGMPGATLNPASAVESEREAVTKIERVGSGSEQVGGVETDHYLITYDVARLNELETGGGTVQGETVTADVWLDAEGRPIRYTSTRTVKAADGQTSTVTIDGLYSDYGKDVTIEVPR